MESWFRITYWNNSGCTQYAGELTPDMLIQGRLTASDEVRMINFHLDNGHSPLHHKTVGRMLLSNDHVSEERQSKVGFKPNQLEHVLQTHAIVVPLNEMLHVSLRVISKILALLTSSLLWYILTLLCFPIVLNAANYLFPSQELYALQDLYDSTNGKEWNFINHYSLYGYPWNFSQPNPNPCNASYPWQGITCTSDCEQFPCETIIISLAMFNLVGSLPPSIGNFAVLKQLYLDNNLLSGSIPAEIGNLAALQYFELSNNQLLGSIPAEIGNLAALQYFELSNNQLSGSIPAEIGNLTALQYFELSNNQLLGSIPAEIGSLVALCSLDVQMNRLSGTIPTEIGNLKELNVLYLQFNKLSGTIPAEIGKLTALLELDLFMNKLSGDIPKEIGNLKELLIMHLNSNDLSGSIPREIGNLMKLSYLNLYNNKLSGNIPPEIGRLTPRLLRMHLDNNQLSGSIPSEIGNLVGLAELYLDNNLLSGSIPEALGNLTRLLNFNASSNKLISSIPASLGKLNILKTLYLYDNLLTGTIPAELDMTAIKDLELYSNRLTGSVPPELINLLRLNTLMLFDNQLTGSIPSLGNWTNVVELSNNFLSSSIPASISILRSLTTFLVDNNLLTGSIPSELVELQSLVLLGLNHNYLSGTIPVGLGNATATYLALYTNIFSGKIPNTLGSAATTAIYIYDNHLSGTIPSKVFQPVNGGVRELKYFAAYGNCLTGSIPLSICHSQYLEQIVLDGMGTSTVCRDKIFKGTSSKQYTLKTHDGGTIPSCLFELPYLDTLHLSGLLLHGTVPSPSALPASLQSLSLSHNQLTGTIPNVYFEHGNWSQLDLSFNKFSGYVLDNVTISGNTTLRLELNRLSGTIPMQISNLNDVNVLDGNMFACDYDNSRLPSQDPNYGSYQCGSDYMNAGLFAWLGVALLLIALNACRLRVEDVCTRCDRLFSNILPFKTGDFYGSISMNLFTKRLLIIYLICVVVLMPLYIILKIAGKYGTYSSQYAWLLSSCFLSGITPTVVLFCVWNILLLITGYQWTKTVRDNTSSATATASNGNLSTSHLIGVVIFIALVVSVVNGAYVYGLGQNISRGSQAAMTIILSLFKTSTIYFSGKLLKNVSNSLWLAILIYCHVVAPYVAELFVSTDCFYYAVLQQSPTVDSTFEISQCTVRTSFINTTYTYSCSASGTTSSYDPPFTYSYTCSAALITDFSYVFVLRYIWGIVILVGHLFLQTAKWNEYFVWIANYIGSSDSAENQTVTMLLDLSIVLTFGVMFPPLAFVIGCTTIIFQLLQNRINQREEQVTGETTIVLAREKEDLVQQRSRASQLVVDTLPYMAILAGWFWSFTLFDTMGDETGAMKASGIVVAMCVCPFVWHGVAILYLKCTGKKIVKDNLVPEPVVRADENALFTQENPLHNNTQEEEVFRETEMIPAKRFEKLKNTLTEEKLP